MHFLKTADRGRSAASRALARLWVTTCRGVLVQLFREALLAEGFQEIHTPKLIAGASEGGAAVFHTDYMGRPGCLAQSPQLYKQMAICGDFDRVFEITPVFRCGRLARWLYGCLATATAAVQAGSPLQRF